MFGWRRKQTREFESLVQAAAEGARRAEVNRALGSVGVQLRPAPDNIQFCISASAAVVRLIAERADTLIDSDDDDRFVAGIFSFVASNHLSRIVGAPFEMVATIAPLELFGVDFADQVPALSDSFNRMSQENRVIETIGQNLAKWIAHPTDEQLSKLAALYKLCRESV